VEQDEKCLAAILCFLSSQAANVTTEEEISNIIFGMFLPSNRNESEDINELTSDITGDSPSLPNSERSGAIPFCYNMLIMPDVSTPKCYNSGHTKEINHVA
jgi:hypothetical protein